MVEDLPRGPRWRYHDFEPAEFGLQGFLHETLRFYYREPLECAQSLLEDPTNGPHVLLPYELYTGPCMQTRVFIGMETGDWWKRMQVRLVTPLHLQFSSIIIVGGSPRHYDRSFTLRE
jgi:hypothetical protein